MPSYLHEGFVELFRHRPALAAELLDEPFGVKVPSWRDARLESAELPELTTTERRADAVVVLSDAEGPTVAVVIEVQLRRDPRKRRSWPVYLATLHARLRCPTMLLVLCRDEPTARWCASPIEVGHPDWVLHPLLAALQSATDEHATLYHDLVMSALPPAARQHLEALMSTGLREYRSEFVRKNVNQGRAEGRAKGQAMAKVNALRSVLSARGIEVTSDADDRIVACTDLDLLDTLIRRAATASSIDDVFTPSERRTTSDA